MPKDQKTHRAVVEEVAPTEKIVSSPKPEEPVIKDEEVKPETPVIKKTAPPSVNFLWIIIPGMVLLGLLMGGIVAYYTGLQKLALTPKDENAKQTTSVQIPTSSPTATPETEADLSKIKIKILNGSGIKGEAGKVQNLLEKAGFVIASTGNAKTYDYTETIIQAKSSVSEAFLTKLKSTLVKTYAVGKNETLKDSETFSLIILVGSTKAD
jgi:hypothetical protein